jgi:outer membrane protein OmpA-like peptidoglycan-associated protein
LTRARAAVAQAESDPNIAKYAPIELDRSRKLLANAEGVALGEHHSTAEAAHYAYLAAQMARIAEQRAHEQVALARIQAGETQRRELLDAKPTSAARAPLEGARVANTTRGLVLTLEGGQFDKGRAELKAAARDRLDDLVEFLNDHPERRVQIEGFTDDAGARDYNLELSQDRADAVAMALIERGIDPARLRAVGYGARYALAGNDSDARRAANRRVEIIVSKGGAAIAAQFYEEQRRRILLRRLRRGTRGWSAAGFDPAAHERGTHAGLRVAPHRTLARHAAGARAHQPRGADGFDGADLR